MEGRDKATPWKWSTAALSVACVVLMLTARWGPSSELSKAVGAATTPTPATVELRKFDGPERLVAATRDTLGGLMNAAGPLRYVSAGVSKVTVDIEVVDETLKKDGATNIDIHVRMLVTTQPGNVLLAAISAAGTATVDANVAQTVSSTKIAALDAAAKATFQDLLMTIKRKSATPD